MLENVKESTKKFLYWFGILYLQIYDFELKNENLIFNYAGENGICRRGDVIKKLHYSDNGILN